ncbi:Ig-like domain-containing protein [Paenarthrobacter sp. NPDC090522]|uniref:Ig-like domain-containing protein n=1 Tax=Paenarthrobacter sp. NPDC090522 TaxID=3364383 RepID=UPI003816D8B2
MKAELRERLLAEASAHIRTYPADMEGALESGMQRLRRRTIRTWVVALAAAILLTAGLVAVRVFLDRGPAALASIEVSASATALRPDATVQLSANGVYSDGSRRSLMDGVVWASENPAVAEVAGSGEVTALAPGDAGMTATYDGVSGRLALTVTRPGPAPLTALRIFPETVSLQTGGKVQLDAVGSFSDGSIGKLNVTAVWASDRPAVAQVDGNGLVTAVSAGSATVTATEAGLQAVARLTVTPKPPATLTGLHLDPAEATLKDGQSRQFTAVGEYSDGTTETLAAVTWSTGNPKVATVSAAGLVTGQSVGQLLVTALHVDDAGKQWQAQSKVTVAHAVTAVVVNPPGPFALDSGQTVQLTATVAYSDGLPGNATVVWASSRPIFASVDGNGLVRAGPGQGQATVAATAEGVSSKAVTVSVGPTVPTPGPVK